LPGLGLWDRLWGVYGHVDCIFVDKADFSIGQLHFVLVVMDST